MNHTTKKKLQNLTVACGLNVAQGERLSSYNQSITDVFPHTSRCLLLKSARCAFTDNQNTPSTLKPNKH